MTPSATRRSADHVRDAVEFFAIGTVVTSFALALPAFAVALAILDHRDERGKGATAGAIDAERNFAYLVGGIGVALTLVVVMTSVVLVARAGRSIVHAPRTVAICVVAAAASVVAAVMVAMAESPSAAATTGGAVCIVAASLFVVVWTAGRPFGRSVHPSDAPRRPGTAPG